jgi:hypothetical protein
VVQVTVVLAGAPAPAAFDATTVYATPPAFALDAVHCGPVLVQFVHA